MGRELHQGELVNDSLKMKVNEAASQFTNLKKDGRTNVFLSTYYVPSHLTHNSLVI